MAIFAEEFAPNVGQHGTDFKPLLPVECQQIIVEHDCGSLGLLGGVQPVLVYLPGEAKGVAAAGVNDEMQIDLPHTLQIALNVTKTGGIHEGHQHPGENNFCGE